MLVSEAVLAYWHQHASKLPSALRVKYSMGHITDYFEGRTVKEAARLSDQFVQAMLEKGLARTSINNLLTILKAAINRAWKRGELSSAPYIGLIEAQSKKPKGAPVSPAEIGLLLSHANKNTYTMIMLMAGTACRPQAAAELTWEQIDFEHGLIDLNQLGRVQTPKYRPVVKIPPTLRDYLLSIRKPSGLLISHGGRVIRRWETAWRSCRVRAGMGKECNPYSLRHGAARWMRSKGVPLDQISGQLGHRRAGLSITEIYAPFDPAYLTQACEALNELLQVALQKRAVA